MFQTFTYLWGLENLVLTFISFKKIYTIPNKLHFIYPFVFLNGAFVWEDMFVFGIFHLLSVVIGVFAGDLRIFALLFLLFWSVRCSGEILYFFLQQFLMPKHHPHNISAHFGPLRKMFGNISDQKCFILMQVFLQTILTLVLCALFLVLIHWNEIGIIRPVYLKL